jgi:cyclase
MLWADGRMLRSRFIPVLLLRGDGLYKGVRFRDFKYVGDPMNAVRIFNGKDADELMLLNVSGTPEGRPWDVEFLRKVADECYMPFGVGGGIRSVDDMRQVLRAGAEKIVINTAAVENPDLIRQGAEVFGAQSVTVGIDVDRGLWGRAVVKTHCGTRRTRMDPVEWAQRAEGLGAGEILLNCIHRDGTGAGYDIDVVRKLADAVGIPVIAGGGAGSEEDLRACIVQGHAAAAAAGSLFVFTGRHRSVLITYPQEGARPPLHRPS